MGQFLTRGVSVNTSFDYVSFDNEPGADLNTPRFWEGDPTESTLQTPTWVKTPNVTVRDIRPEQDNYDFLKDGFQLLGIPTAHSPHPDHQDEVQAYLGETAAHVRKLLSASQAFVFDYRVSHQDTLCQTLDDTNCIEFRINQPRSSDRQHHQKNSPGRVGREMPDAPFTKPHVDHTEPEAYRRLRRYLSPAEVQRHLGGPRKSRFMIVNAWRPLNLPVEDMPLALCEFPSLDLSDVASSHFHGGPGYIAETYVLRHNKNQKWVWFGQQRPDELLVFKNFDSEPGNSPRFIPHAAFLNPSAKKDAVPRESIECRMIVIFDHEEGDSRPTARRADEL